MKTKMNMTHEGAFGRLRSLKNVGGVIEDREGDPGTSSSSTAVPKAAKAKGEMTGVLPDLEDIPNILPRGGLLRALMKGGPPAIKAAKEVHRRWDHMPLGEMQVLFKRANLDPSLISELKKIIEDCPICRMWMRLPPRQVARGHLAERFNEKVWLDLLFVDHFLHR